MSDNYPIDPLRWELNDLIDRLDGSMFIRVFFFFFRELLGDYKIAAFLDECGELPVI